MREKIKVGVYVKDSRFLDKALGFTSELINEKKEKIIDIKNSCNYKQITTDSTIYYILIASQGARGYRFNIIYYQDRIDKEICECTIETQIRPYKILDDYFLAEYPIRKIDLGVV